MYSFTKKSSKNKPINPNKLILNQKKSSLSINNQNIINNKKISFSQNKNNSRNDKTKLLLLNDSNSDEISNPKKNYNKTTYNKKLIKNADLFFKNMSNRKKNKIKKNIYKKKLKELFEKINNENNDKNFKNKTYLFDHGILNKIKIPKIKTQQRLNNYLIYDFKETETPMTIINRSIKNRIIYDEYELFKSLLQEKKCNRNYKFTKEYKSKYDQYDKKNEYSYSINSYSNNSNVGKKFERPNKRRLSCYNPVVIYNELYKSYYKQKTKDNDILLFDFSNKANNKKDLDLKSTKDIIYQTSLSNNSKESISRSPLRKKSEQQKSFSYNKNLSQNINLRLTNFLDKNNKNYQLKYRNHIKLSNRGNYFERLYKEHKNEYNHYVKKSQELRSMTYAEEISKIEREKEELMKESTEWEDNKRLKFLTLNENRLILEIKKKNVFLNSFGIIGKKNNGKNDDVDTENYKDVKNYHMNMGLGALYMQNLKFRIEPSYIKKNFKKKTVDKYKSNRGVFFGPRTIEETEDLKKRYI